MTDRWILPLIFKAGHCDPWKCTAEKLERTGYALTTSDPKKLARCGIILFASAPITISGVDKKWISKAGLGALDFSWARGIAYKKIWSQSITSKIFLRKSRKLPFLVAGNPVNYGKPFLLSTAEALASAYWIADFKKQALMLLERFSWKNSFVELNTRMLDEYSKASDPSEISNLERIFQRVESPEL